MCAVCYLNCQLESSLVDTSRLSRYSDVVNSTCFGVRVAYMHHLQNELISWYSATACDRLGNLSGFLSVECEICHTEEAHSRGGAAGIYS